MKNYHIGSYSSQNRKVLTINKPKQKIVDNKNVNRKKRKISIRFVVGLFLILVLFFGTITFLRINEITARVEQFTGTQEVDVCTNILNPECWTQAFRPQLKKTDGFTNALIVGLDTRTNGSNSLKNTDTIIFVSYNHETNKTMMVSIPRDFYIAEYGTKINGVYAFTQNKNPDDPFFYLKETVSGIVGMPIHYLATVKFEGVIEAVNKLGGVEVCIDDSVRAQYPNDEATPTSPNQWLFFDFESGCQFLDGEKALVYSRFRYVAKGPSYYASDFSRARRQQQVIEGVKDKLLSTETSITEKAENFWSLLQSFNESVKFEDLSFEDILAVVNLLDNVDKDPANGNK